jgi:dimethylargininase
VLLAANTIDPTVFPEAVIIPHDELYAANCVAIGEHAIAADGFPATRTALEHAGFTIHAVPTSEVRKADGSLTCQSIVFP